MWQAEFWNDTKKTWVRCGVPMSSKRLVEVTLGGDTDGYQIVEVPDPALPAVEEETTGC